MFVIKNSVIMVAMAAVSFLLSKGDEINYNNHLIANTSSDILNLFANNYKYPDASIDISEVKDWTRNELLSIADKQFKYAVS
eukprot:Pgem_evm1s8753